MCSSSKSSQPSGCCGFDVVASLALHPFKTFSFSAPGRRRIAALCSSSKSSQPPGCCGFDVVASLALHPFMAVSLCAYPEGELLRCAPRQNPHNHQVAAVLTSSRALHFILLWQSLSAHIQKANCCVVLLVKILTTTRLLRF